MGPEFESPADHQKSHTPSGVWLFCRRRFERSNATRTSVAADGLRSANLYFCLLTGKNANESRHSDEYNALKTTRPKVGRVAVFMGLSESLNVLVNGMLAQLDDQDDNADQGNKADEDPAPTLTCVTQTSYGNSKTGNHNGKGIDRGDDCRKMQQIDNEANH